MLSIGLNFLLNLMCSISKTSMYQLLQPQLDIILFEIVFPLMCFNDNDQKLWSEDPHEYVRKGYGSYRLVCNTDGEKKHLPAWGEGMRRLIGLSEAKKQDDAEVDDDMDGIEDDDEDEEESDKEMGDDAEDGDEADSLKLQKLAAEVVRFNVFGSFYFARGFQSNDEDDDSDDDYSDDEEFQSPIDEVDPFIFFIDTVQAVQASDPTRFQNLTRTLDFHYQALASGVAQHAEQRRVEIEKEKLEKAATQ
ncbi:hypothetical protein GW17_00026555 [Ensete ventricosum]|nr:hypothetical protein GW17_00026555 [Ensete ventricosum]